jgi:hypothetical protein
MLTSFLGWNFFGLSSNHGQYLANEYLILGKNIGTSYSDFLVMPTYFRKYLLRKLNEINNPNS